ncbi:enolase C-terminal domain-like protein [Sphingomonas sp. H39-1-10]|uniref:mandelate racemase/muconate lactonizing enzyme family protein n=1 Tax=Sphingomonas pollutisoli TaxID=3030829 RepID=UPI0023B9C9F9|nr:enolase C-terminal domain-like protein [Sphingomonas pollutisoli]MDF0487148.1 enolase C-terminal domain-like protein [Sphingomonas pollutisoli]
MSSMPIVAYRLTRLAFERDRTIGDSQVRATTAQLVAVELIDTKGNVGLGFAQSLFTSLPDAGEIDRIFAAEAWPALEGRHPAALALAVTRVRGGNARRMGLPFEESLQHAIWDLFAKQSGLPLWRMLGGQRSAVGVYASGLDYHLSDHDFTELFGNARERGFLGYKIKVGHPDLERDLHRLDLLRKAVGTDRPVMIDANEAWTAQETIQAVRLFERAGHSIYWLEDPIPRDDIDGLKMLRHLGISRINAGEYLDLTGKRKLIEARACDMLNVHGQVSDVMRAGWLANEANVEVTLGNTFLELGVNMALALPGVRWLEYSFQNFDHLVDEPYAMADGLIHGREAPGHGLVLSDAARANGGALPHVTSAAA